MKQSDIIRREIFDLTTEAEGVIDAAEAAGRGLIPAEAARLDEILGNKQLGKTGLVEELRAELDRAMDGERIERAKNMDRLQNLPPVEPVFDHLGTGRYVPQPQVKSQTLRAFSGNGNRQQAEQDAHAASLWFLGRVKGESDAMRKFEARYGSWLATQNEANPTQGGYLSFPQFANAVMYSMQSVGIARRLARVVNVGGESFTYPKASSGTSVKYPGEEGSIDASNMEFGRVNLLMKKRAIYSLVSNELREDNGVQLMDLLAQDMGHQLAKQQDSEITIGDATASYGGVLGIRPALIAATASTQSAATGHDTWPELDYGDFGLLMAKLPAKYRQANGLKFLCSPSFKFSVMDRLALAQGGALATNIIDGVPTSYFLGHEVVLSDDFPTATATNTVCCAFGNFERAVLLGERSDLRIAMSADVAFATDQTAVRATYRYDIAVHEQGDTSNAGAIVALATAS